VKLTNPCQSYSRASLLQPYIFLFYMEALFMAIVITDFTAHRVLPELPYVDQAELIRLRETAALSYRQARAHLTREELIQAGEDAARQLFG
jgi:hypothetical protein